MAAKLMFRSLMALTLILFITHKSPYAQEGGSSVDYSKVAWSPTPSPSPWEEWQYDPKGAGRTWKYVEELTPEEREYWQIDPRWGHEIPRDKEFPWLPAERYPFSPPWSGEELSAFSDMYWQTGMCGLRTHYGYHINRTMDRTGIMVKSDWLCRTAKRFRTFAEELYNLKPGQEEGYFLMAIVAPPENQGVASLSKFYKDTPESKKEEDRWTYIPSFRRVRRFSGATGEDYVQNTTGTYDDAFTRDFWEYDSRIIGVDILYQSAAQNKPYGPIQGPYRKDGGVECYVVLSKHKRPGYYLSQWLTWHERKSFHVIRIEQWDKNGNFKKIDESGPSALVTYFGREVYVWEEAMKGGLSEGGSERRAVLHGGGPYLSWDVELDLRCWIIPSGPDKNVARDAFGDYSVFPEDWETYFTPQRLEQPFDYGNPIIKVAAEDFPARPPLYRDRLPKYRKIVLPSELEQKIKEEELGKRGLFKTSSR